MDGQLYELFRECTVRLKTPSDYGTGFWVAPGLILTCTHVVKGADINLIQVCWQEEIYIPDRVEPLSEPDLALLSLPIDHHPCVYLDEEVKPGHKLYSYGYPDQDRDGASITVECEGPSDKGQLLTIKDENVRPGFSGAPLLNQHTLKVCGIIKSGRNVRVTPDILRGVGGQAIPIRVIFHEWPELQDKNLDFHERDRSWISFLSTIEALDSDWESLDATGKRITNYLKTSLFLLGVLCSWLILGLFAKNSFPFEFAISLLLCSLTGKIGQEVRRQQKQLKQLELSPFYSIKGEAKRLNKLDSRYWLLIKIIDFASGGETDSISTSRLFWTIEALDEQRAIILELKNEPSNTLTLLSNIQNFIQRIFSSINPGNRELTKTNLVLNMLIHNYVFVTTQYYIEIHEIFINLTITLKEYPLFIDSFNLTIVFLGDLFKEVNKILDLAIAESLEKLDQELIKNKRIKLLYKIRILLHWIAKNDESVFFENSDGVFNEKPQILIQGGPIRSWINRRTYHFNRDCKLYPERVKYEEKTKIICYNSREEAEKDNRNPCKICIKLNVKAD
ncbi:serine protease [Laspinema sp. A4]|uniref:S1 family peptidase n=1 Tax=Laspinema sp. D2d TaxID=2953686 RepID=UPI0021BAECFA|nr:serine protease [Laspinema sp. D2d]MCT7983229.1 serine protease [Laspinema sp. D2d]